MLLTNDLTPDVVEEAISYQVSVIVSYRELFPSALHSLYIRIISYSMD